MYIIIYVIICVQQYIYIQILCYFNFVHGQEPQHGQPKSHVRQNRGPVVEDEEKLKPLRADKLSTRIIVIIIVIIGQVYDLLNALPLTSLYIYIRGPEDKTL